MNNLLSYCGLTVARMRASEKDLLIHGGFRNLLFRSLARNDSFKTTKVWRIQSTTKKIVIDNKKFYLFTKTIGEPEWNVKSCKV